MGFIENIILKLANIYSKIYGDVYQGYLENEKKIVDKKFYEKPLFLFPSFINHLYGSLVRGVYFYKKNNLIYFSNIPQSIKINPPILQFYFDKLEMKNQIMEFANSVPLKYIVNYYGFPQKPKIIKIKYLKYGIKEKELNYSDVKDLSLSGLF